MQSSNFLHIWPWQKQSCASLLQIRMNDDIDILMVLLFFYDRMFLFLPCQSTLTTLVSPNSTRRFERITTAFNAQKKSIYWLCTFWESTWTTTVSIESIWSLKNTATATSSSVKSEVQFTIKISLLVVKNIFRGEQESCLCFSQCVPKAICIGCKSSRRRRQLRRYMSDA